MRIYNECLNEKNYNDIKLVTRTYRLLAKHKHGRSSNIVSIKVKKPNNREYEKEGMYNNERVSKGKNKPLNEHSLNVAVEYGQSRKNRSYLCNRENSCSGKRILDSMYYKNKVKYSTNSDFKFLKDSIKGKGSTLCALLGFHGLIGIILIILVDRKFLESITFDIYEKFGLNSISLGFGILTFIVILAIIYLIKIIIKFVQIIDKKREILNTAYPPFHKDFYNGDDV
ncbi:Plasmodium exported protein (Pm-fam-a like), unknown function [Plasmodium malariae]|uniref:Uncharacterized protein n=1 Tax=Plasmodium malariae TaxID=5858 RepID=A0A1A8WMI6_PLAMA|nr:Plasmodium exported protein (Pm-fam-a like), unknown function [Plasmodium malariae]